MRAKIYRWSMIALLIGLIAWTVFEVKNGRYFEAIAVSGVGTVLLWFALGRQDQAPHAEPERPREDQSDRDKS